MKINSNEHYLIRSTKTILATCLQTHSRFYNSQITFLFVFNLFTNCNHFLLNMAGFIGLGHEPSHLKTYKIVPKVNYDFSDYVFGRR